MYVLAISASCGAGVWQFFACHSAISDASGGLAPSTFFFFLPVPTLAWKKNARHIHHLPLLSLGRTHELTKTSARFCIICFLLCFTVRAYERGKIRVCYSFVFLGDIGISHSMRQPPTRESVRGCINSSAKKRRRFSSAKTQTCVSGRLQEANFSNFETSARFPDRTDLFCVP